MHPRRKEVIVNGFPTFTEIYGFDKIDWCESYSVCLFFALVNPNYESSSLNYFIVEFPQIDISLKLESHQVSCVLFVKTYRKPFFISFGNVRKSKSSGTKIKHGWAITPASRKRAFLFSHLWVLRITVQTFSFTMPF